MLSIPAKRHFHSIIPRVLVNSFSFRFTQLLLFFGANALTAKGPAAWFSLCDLANQQDADSSQQADIVLASFKTRILTIEQHHISMLLIANDQDSLAKILDSVIVGNVFSHATEYLIILWYLTFFNPFTKVGR